MRRTVGRVIGIGVAVALALAVLPGFAARKSRATFLYVHDNGAPNQVWSYRFNSDGSLDPLAGQPVNSLNGNYNAPGVCGSAAYSSRRKLLFTAGSVGVSVFQVAADGSLSLVPGSPFLPQVEIQSVAVAEIGKKTYVYGSDPVSKTIHLYTVQGDGSLLAGPDDELPLLLGGPTGLHVVKNVLFFGNQDGTTAGCKIRKDGSLQPIFGYDLSFSGTVNSVYPNPTGKLLFVPDGTAPQVFGYQLNGKRAKPLNGSPYASTLNTSSGVASMAVGAGKHLFAFAPASDGDGDVQPFRIKKRGLSSTPVQDSGMPSLKGGAIDPTGRFLVLVDDISDQLKSFSVDRATGALTLVDTETAAFGDNDVNGLVFARR